MIPKTWTSMPSLHTTGASFQEVMGGVQYVASIHKLMKIGKLLPPTTSIEELSDATRAICEAMQSTSSGS